MASPRPGADTLARLDQLLHGLELPLLGEIYCEEGGDAFWAAHLGPLRELGLVWAAALCERLPPGGRSLYAGAGVAELPALLCEHLELGRELRVCNLDAAECESLNRSLAAVGIGAGLRFVAEDAGRAGGEGYDHLSVVSLFSDPVQYPLCSAVGYGRMPPVLLDLEGFAAERQRLAALAGCLLAGLADGGLVTTTFEDLPWLLHSAEAAGWSLVVEEIEAVPTAVVGDPLGFARIHRG